MHVPSQLVVVIARDLRVSSAHGHITSSFIAICVAFGTNLCHLSSFTNVYMCDACVPMFVFASTSVVFILYSLVSEREGKRERERDEEEHVVVMCWWPWLTSKAKTGI